MNPITWLGWVEGMPRGGALLLLVVALAMLVVGQRFFPAFVRLGAVAAAWLGGLFLAPLMKVEPWTIAAAASLIALVVTWRLAMFLGPLAIGAVAGAGTGTVLVLGFDIKMFWVAFAAGTLAVGLLAFFASRFMNVLFSAAFGTFVVLSGLGAVVRAPEGFFAVGGYRQYPMVDVVMATVLLVGAIILQVVLEPEQATGRQGAK